MLLVSPPPVALQEIIDDRESVSQTIVTATRSPSTVTSSNANVTVLTGEDLRKTGERSLPRAISKAAGYAGVWLQETNLGGGSPFIRGLTGNQILVVVDGVRLNDSTTRFGPNQNLNKIDPSVVERVEILRGPSSVLYGSDAIGGAILIWTRRRLPAPDEQERGLRAGLDLMGRTDADGGRASLSLSHAGDSLSWVMIGSLQDWDDLRAGGGEEQLFSGYHGNGFFASFDYRIDEWRSLRASAMVYRDFDARRTDKMVAGFGQTQPAFQLWNFKLEERERYVLALEDRKPRAFADQIEARLSLRRSNEQREKQKTGSSTFKLEEEKVETVGLGVDFHKSIGDTHLLTYGFDLDSDEVEASRLDTDLSTGSGTPKDGRFPPDPRYTSAGLFLRDEILALDPWAVTAGLRFSIFDFAFDRFDGSGRESGSFQALTASLQAAREITEGVRVSGTLAQGFRAPNLSDLAKEGTFGGGTELANPDLEPEQSLTAELALDLQRGPWQGALAAYGTQLDDVIGRVLVDEGDPTQTGDETFLRENVGKLRIWGIEGGLGRRVGGEGSPFSVAASAAYAWGQQFDDTVDPMTGEKPLDDVPWRRIPPLHGRLGLSYDPAETRFGIGWAELELVWATEQDQLHPQDVLDPRIDPDGTPGWAVVNLDLGGPLGGRTDARWSVGLHNIFDENYRIHGSGIDALGFGVVVGMSWNL